MMAQFIEAEVAPNPVESPPLAATQVHSKVGGAAIGIHLAVVTVWTLSEFGLEMPDPVAVAVGGLFGAVAGYIAKS